MLDAPVLVVADEPAETPIPKGFKIIGNVVCWNGTPSFTDINVLLKPSVEVRPGQFLGVLHGGRRSALTVIQVGTSIEVNPNEEPELAAARSALGLGRSYGAEGVSTRIFRLAACATIEDFDIDDDGHVIGEGRAPELLARAGDLVVLLPTDVAIATIGGMADPDGGIAIGETYGASAAPVTLVPQIFQLHIGVFGNPGKGKSYLTGNLLEEAVAWNIPTLVLDINGEMIAAAKALGGLVITLPDPDQFGISLKLMTPPELVAITPNVQPNTQYADLIELAHDQLRNESRGNEITFAALKKRVSDLGTAGKTPPASVGAAVARLGVLERDPLIGTAFDFIAQLKQHRLIVLDCRFLSMRQTQLIAAAAARVLQREGREQARRAEDGDTEAAKWFALYFVDEAHAVAPNDDHVISSQVMFELARMGRHVRTGMVLTSQSPQDVNASVLKRLQLRFVFSLERDQLRSIQGVMADLDERIAQQLPKLPRGVCAVSGSSELVRHGFLLKVRERVTPVGGRTPSVFAGRTKKLPTKK